MRVVIAIDIFPMIKEQILFTLGDQDYKIMIKEVALAFQVVHQNYLRSYDSNMEDKDSNGDVSGLEDLDDDGASRNDMA